MTETTDAAATTHMPDDQARKRGGSLLQSDAELQARNRSLARTLGELMTQHATVATGKALDVGCQAGTLIDLLADTLPLKWTGIDPRIAEPERSPGGAPLIHGWGHELEFPDDSFDVVLFANVWEHVDPSQRDPSLREMLRVLAPGGILVGQLPNPHFLIESHSRLPFLGWMPKAVQRRYWRLSPVWWDHDFHSVTARHLKRHAEAAGFETVVVRNFNYPLEAIPKRVRPIARALRRPMSRLPWAWQFVFRKPGS